MEGVTALSQGAWYRPDRDGVDRAGAVNVLTSLRPTPYAKGNPQHTNLVEVKNAVAREDCYSATAFFLFHIYSNWLAYSL